MTAVRRIAIDTCCGVLIDYQDFFLQQLDDDLRSRISARTSNVIRLLGYLRVPMVATLERPVDRKGSLPADIGALLSGETKVLEKDFFDLTREKPIRDHIARLKKKQVIVAGCETDVCVLQSCLGLLGLGYEVFVVEDALFSSSHDVDAATARMKAAGAVLVTYKMLFYELIAAVDGSPHMKKMIAKLGPFPGGLADSAEQ